MIECVVNVSEGRSAQVIQELVHSIERKRGRVLHVDRGAGANRTVLTFVADQDAILQAAYSLIARASELIDLRSHQGAHPRIGAADVVPFVPLFGTTMAECVDAAKSLGEMVGEQLQIPVFLYEEAATSEERRPLPFFRRGGLDSLDSRMRSGELIPDYGPLHLHPSAGAVVIGARRFLIAFNISLATTSEAKAKNIAKELRALAAPNNTRGRFTGALRAIGWFMPEYGCAQVSCNIIDYKAAPIYQVYQEVRRLSRGSGCDVIGSEIIGLIPEAAFLAVAQDLPDLGGESGANQDKNIVKSLGLELHSPFDPGTRILERVLQSA